MARNLPHLLTLFMGGPMARSSGPRSVKKKATARQNAQNRTQREQHRADVPRLRSDKQVSQSRFPGETPLTGEDRPSGRAGDKQRGFRQDKQQPRSRVKRDTTAAHRAPPV